MRDSLCSRFLAYQQARKMSHSSHNHYTTLGVEASASQAEIVTAYRKAAMKWHPDRNPANVEESERRFKEIQTAYQVLSDPEKREAYDAHNGIASAYFDDEAPAHEPYGYSDTASARQGYGYGFHGFRPQKGPDIAVTAAVDVETLVLGGFLNVKVSFKDDCPECNGFGRVEGTFECSRCGGDGYGEWGNYCRRCYGNGYVSECTCPVCKGRKTRKVEHQFQVRIPPGTPSTATMRLRDKGPEGENGGPRGDVFCSFKVKPHKSFKLSGLNLTVDAKIDFVTALLGGETQVDVFGRMVRLQVPACCRAGRILKVPGEGLVHPNSKEQGDLKVRVILEMPEGVRNLSREHKAILRSMFDVAANKRK
ncbi:DnaJ C-terminal domain-containing protein [Burkholderia ubonensis]|uniref:DnaJ C-terminal domain-containing protein n=1 Tax=Burkholderia ubonensis TaxID=101571 RepID=UPI0009B4B45E